MAQFQQSTTVSVPPEKAYEYLADISKHTEWAPHLASAEKTSDGPVAVGSTFRTVGRQLGTHEAQVRITELVPNEKIVFESEDDTGQFRHSFSLQRSESGTAITKAVEPLRKSLFLTLLSPLTPVIIPRGLATDLKKIRERLEA